MSRAGVKSSFLICSGIQSHQQKAEALGPSPFTGILQASCSQSWRMQDQRLVVRPSSCGLQDKRSPVSFLTIPFPSPLVIECCGTNSATLTSLNQPTSIVSWFLEALGLPMQCPLFKDPQARVSVHARALGTSGAWLRRIHFHTPCCGYPCAGGPSAWFPWLPVFRPCGSPSRPLVCSKLADD